MTREAHGLSANVEKPVDARWSSLGKNQELRQDGASDIEAVSDDVLAEITPYVEKIEPKMLKKAFDGWNKRKERYRKKMRAEEAMEGVSDEECNAWADLFYLGTIYRDYLDTILDLKRPGKSGFQLWDSNETEITEEMNPDTAGWFNLSEHMVNIIGDRLDDKSELLSAIAHEMWHAHQIQVIEEENNEKSELYFRAMMSYVPSSEDDEKYRHQLIEEEAFAFQHFFERKLFEAMDSAPEMRKTLLEEADDEEVFPDAGDLAELVEMIWKYDALNDADDDDDFLGDYAFEEKDYSEDDDS